MILFRRIGFNFCGAKDCAEKEPRTMLARDEVGVFALPAEPGALREGLLHQRRGVDENFDVCIGFARKPLCELLQLALDDVVIVAPGGIRRNETILLLLQKRDRVIGAGVALADEDRAFCVGPKRLRMLARIGAFALLAEPFHVAMAALLQERLQMRASGPGLTHRRNAGGVKAERLSLGLEGVS